MDGTIYLAKRRRKAKMHVISQLQFMVVMNAQKYVASEDIEIDTYPRQFQAEHLYDYTTRQALH